LWEHKHENEHHPKSNSIFTGFSRDHKVLNAAYKDALNKAELPLIHDVRPDEAGPAAKYYQDEINRLLSFTVTFHTNF
jgi:hypothetical protein